MKKTYLLTGGTSGIGLDTISQLAEDKNNKIYSISRSEDKIQLAEKRLSKLPGECIFCRGDVSIREEVISVYQKISQETGCIDGLINNAGVIHPGGIEALDFNRWIQTLNVNLSSAYSVTQAFLPLMKKSDGASIVNVSSISSTLLGSSVGYSVCKAALDMLTKALAKELAKYGIRVNSVNPGITKTGFQVSNELMSSDEYDRFLEDVAKTYPLGLGEPRDVSNLILYLLSEKAKWITGSIMVVDGGRIINS